MLCVTQTYNNHRVIQVLKSEVVYTFFNQPKGYFW